MALLVVACGGTATRDGVGTGGVEAAGAPAVAALPSGGVAGTSGSTETVARSVGRPAAAGSSATATGGGPGGGTGGNTAGTGGVSGQVGGSTSTTGGDTRSWIDAVPSVEEIPIVEDINTCTPPCGLVLVPHEEYPGGAEGAILYFDLDTGEAVLRSDPLTVGLSGPIRLLGFTWEPGNYGYGTWTSGAVFWVFAENFGYDYGYSDWTDTPMRSQLHLSTSDTPVIVVHSFGAEHGVRIHEVRIPGCDPAGAGPCQNADDCPLVENATISELSPDCSACYDQVVACSASHCPDTCPGEGGNACLNCETDAACHTEFMACSGLDYMPLGTLTLPNW